jgi:Uma2 family endonuclease
MATAATRRAAAQRVAAETMADLVARLGGVPLDRLRIPPAPGMATEKDLIAALEGPQKRICELVDGVLVEKPMGTKEALLGGVIAHRLWDHVEPQDLGVIIPADGPLRPWLGLVRIPDVSFVSWDRIPRGEFPDDPIAGIIPNLAVEVLSKGNTPREMQRKLQEYFAAGVQLVWLIDPRTQTAESYVSPTKKRKTTRNQALDGGAVLPGFTLALKDLFAILRRRRGSR